jgi:hypothetical protein
VVGGPSSGAKAHATSPLGLKTVVGCASSTGGSTVVGGASSSQSGHPVGDGGAAGLRDTERWVGSAPDAACWWASAGP